MQRSITEIRFTSPGGKVNVYLFCKPQYILEASPAGLVAKGLWGKFTPSSPTSTPLSNPPPHTHTHPFKLWVYVPGPSSKLPVYKYTDMLILVASIYFWELSCPCKCTLDCYLVIVYCASGCWFTQEISLCVSVDDTDEGRTDIWDKWRPNCVTGDRAVVNKLATPE